jgi:hypothetical protein
MIPRLLMFHYLALMAACAAHTQPPRVDAAQPSDPKVEVKEAARVRDLARLKSIQPNPTDDPKLWAELARALYWTGGVAEAKAALSAACSDNRLPLDSPERARACAVLAFDDLAAGKPMNHVTASGQGVFLDKQKLFIAMIAVNGNPPEPFIVDTGAPMMVISKRYADRVKIAYRTDVADRSSDAAGKPVVLSPTVLTSLKWGGIEIETVPAYVLELPENFKVGGILAPQDVLRGTPFEIDGPGRALRSLPEQTSEAWMKGISGRTHQAPLHWNGGNFFVDAQGADLPSLTFLLDSGAGGNGVCEEALQKHGKSLDGGVEGNSATAAGSHRVRAGITGAIAVASDSPQTGELFVAPCPRDDEDSIEKAGYVGAPWFWSRRVFFPIDRRSIAFTEAAPAP